MEKTVRTVRIANQRGLHARASARFVECAKGFDADVRVTKDDLTVKGVSIMGLLMLAASIGCEIEITAEGVEAVAAVEALSVLVESKFHED